MTDWVDGMLTSSGQSHRTPQNDKLGGRDCHVPPFLAMKDLDRHFHLHPGLLPSREKELRIPLFFSSPLVGEVEMRGKTFSSSSDTLEKHEFLFLSKLSLQKLDFYTELFLKGKKRIFICFNI